MPASQHLLCGAVAGWLCWQRRGTCCTALRPPRQRILGRSLLVVRHRRSCQLSALVCCSAVQPRSTLPRIHHVRIASPPAQHPRPAQWTASEPRSTFPLRSGQHRRLSAPLALLRNHQALATTLRQAAHNSRPCHMLILLVFRTAFEAKHKGFAKTFVSFRVILSGTCHYADAATLRCPAGCARFGHRRGPTAARPGGCFPMQLGQGDGARCFHGLAGAHSAAVAQEGGRARAPAAPPAAPVRYS